MDTNILTHVKGIDKGKVMLFELSTCIWCKKTQHLLNDMGIDYYYVYVDLLDKSENLTVMDEIKKWNPDCSFPTLVINDSKCVIGFKEDKIRKELQ